ncbi:hypothetical protein DRQ33_05050, partial [bacterium]
MNLKVLNGNKIIFTILIIVLLFVEYSEGKLKNFQLNSTYEDFKIVQTEQGIKIELDGIGFYPENGFYAIQYRLINYLLPAGERAVSIKIIGEDTETLNIMEPPAVMNSSPIGRGNTDENVFTQGVKYCQRPVSLAYSNTVMGYPIANVKFFPVTYDTSGKYIFHRVVEFDIITEPVEYDIPDKSTALANNFRTKFIHSVCQNNDDIYPLNITTVELDEIYAQNYNVPPLPGDDPADFLIITTDSLVSYCQEYLDETKYGFLTRIVTVEQILPYYSGVDEQEKIRKFIQQAYSNWGIIALLLVGDYTHIPVRYLNQRDRTGTWIDTPSDLYYSALDGTMNFDLDEQFGESIQDDRMPELFHSRLQVNTPDEIVTFSEKFHHYRFEHPREFFEHILFIGASIQTSGTDNTGARKKENIISNTGLDSIFEMTRMYSNHTESGGDIEITADNFRSSLNSGYFFINHFDHGNQINLSMGSRSGGGSLTLFEIACLENDFFPLMYSFSCDVNRFDTDNIARRWILNPQGGGIAMFGHANTAWASQAEMDDLLWDRFTFGKPLFSGELLSMWLAVITGDPYSMVILGLSGHPLTPFPTNRPQNMEISYTPLALVADDTTLAISIEGTITDSILFALAGRERVLARKFIDTTEFNMNFRILDEDTIWLTVYSFPMKHFAIPINPAETRRVRTIYARMVESIGDNDNIVEYGESFSLRWCLKNEGIMPFDGYSKIELPSLGIVESVSVILMPDDTSSFTTGIYSLTDSIGEPISVPILIENLERVDTFTSTIAGPLIEPIFTIFRDSDYDFPEPEESAFLGVILKNPLVGNISTAIASIDGEFDFYPDSIVLENLSSTEYDTVWFTFIVPEDFAGELPVEFKIGDSFREYLWNLTLRLPEPPDSLWTLSADNEITVLWRPPDDNSISGYFVFRSTSPDGAYSPLNSEPIIHSRFTDEIQGEITEFYYRIVSMDSMGNLSIPSAPVYGWLTLGSQRGFPVNLPIGVWPRCAPAILDADNDGIKEIYVPDIIGNVCAFRADGTDLVDIGVGPDPILSTGAPFNQGFWSSPAVGDIDNNDTLELVLADRRGPSSQLFVIDPWGNHKPGFPINTGYSTLASIVLADLDDDSFLEIIQLVENSKLMIYRYDGSPYLGDNPVVDSMPECVSGVSYSSPAVADIDNDGNLDIIAGAGNDADGNGLIYAWSSDGLRKDGFPIAVPCEPWGAPVIGNLDDDQNTLEFVIYINTMGLYAFDYSGEILHGFPVGLEQLGSDGGIGIRTPALADFNGDGKCEIIFTSETRLSVINHHGIQYTGFPVDYGNPHWSGPLVGDIDGDGVQEILSPNDIRFYAFETDGNFTMPGFPLTVQVGLSSPAAIDDMDNDGYMEIIAPALNSMLYVWETLHPVDSFAGHWTHFRQNQRRTGALILSPTGIEHSNKKPTEPIIKVFPNPFNSICYIQAPAGANIIVQNIRGNIIERIHMGENMWEPEIDIQSGIYFLKIRWNENTYYRK